uniref:Mediator of RNA polymerase II transcription subunit 22 n=1 Tax=Compsopogon caeruleus TaxID=31354 RepID=A0A7S1TFS1_9RHOD|mmetsp:Transcript_18518/g.38799  ORF Transcript_18518/g.38799 Transcript_18518/m.38799 type:complete len:159 (+) Transcript_18518:537-1013(+)
MANSNRPPTSIGSGSLNDCRLSYLNNLDQIVNQIADAFRDIARASRVKSRASEALSELQIEVEAANLVQNVDKLLRLISDLKVRIIAQDFEATDRDVKAVQAQLDEQSDRSTRLLRKVVGNTSKVLRQLEHHYYLSESNLPGSVRLNKTEDTGHRSNA